LEGLDNLPPVRLKSAEPREREREREREKFCILRFSDARKMASRYIRGRTTALNNGATPERVAGIYRRDFSPKRKLPALFRAITKLREGEGGTGRHVLNRTVIEKKEKREREKGGGTPERTAGAD